MTKAASQLIDESVAESLRVKTQFFEENKELIARTADAIAIRVRSGGKIMFFGNGGSASDAQHLAAEMAGRFEPDRPAVAAISLTADTSLLTAVGNDYGFQELFARQILALGRPGDVAVGISTSGNSANVLHALDIARAQGLYTVGLTGKTGGKMSERTDVLFRVPCRRTPRIQETHILLGHILCELIDRQLFPEAYAAG